MNFAVVDDDEMILTLIKEFLARYFRESFVRTFNNCEDFLGKPNINFFDLIIVDYSFPTMSGKEFAEIVKSRYDIPIIMITAQGDSQLVRDLFFNELIDDFVDKPIDLDVFLKRISNFIKKQKKVDYMWIKELYKSSKIKINLSRIDYIATSNKQKVIEISTNQKKYYTRGVLNEYDKYLDSNLVKISRNIIINLQNLEKINYHSNSIVFLSNNEIEIPKNKMEVIEEYID